MSGFIGNDGSQLAGGLDPSSVIKGLHIDALGNLYTTAAQMGFTATTGKQTSAGAVSCAAAIFNPAANTKNILIYSIRIFVASAGSQVINLITTDQIATLTSLMTVSNQKPGGGSSSIAASCEFLNAAAGVAPGTTFDVIANAANVSTEVLTNGAVILLPAGSANGVYVQVNTSTNAWGITFRYIEY